MRKRYRAEIANEQSPAQLAEADRARIDAEPKPARQPSLRVGNRAWFIDTDTRWYEVEVVEKRGRAATTFKPVTGRDSTREKEWPYGALLEIGRNSKLRTRLRHINARRP